MSLWTCSLQHFKVWPSTVAKEGSHPGLASWSYWAVAITHAWAGENHKQPDTQVGAAWKWCPARIKQQISDKCRKTPKTHEKQQCPAQDILCHKCSKCGHFKNVCRSAQVGELHLNTHSESDEEFFLGGHTGETNDLHKNSWLIMLFFNGNPTKFEIDTGVEVTIISERAHQNNGEF